MIKFRLGDKSRKFAKDVDGIVLGVLIALAIGEAADSVRKRVNARTAFHAVRADMIDNVALFETMVLTAPCLRQRLESITTEIEHAQRSGQLRNIGEIGRGPLSTFRTGAWERASANGDTLYMNKKGVGDLTDYHDIIRSYKAAMYEGNMDWARLSVLSQAPGTIDNNTLSAAQQTVAELREHVWMLTMMSPLLLQLHKSLGFPVEYTPFNGVPRTADQVRRDISQSQICQPLEIADFPA